MRAARLASGPDTRRANSSPPRRVEQVLVAQGLETLADLPEHAIPGFVRVGVVDLLEAVEIEIDEHAGRVGLAFQLDRPVEALDERRPVRQAGQQIMAGGMTGDGLAPLDFADAAHGYEHQDAHGQDQEAEHDEHGAIGSGADPVVDGLRRPGQSRHHHPRPIDERNAARARSPVDADPIHGEHLAEFANGGRVERPGEKQEAARGIRRLLAVCDDRTDRDCGDPPLGSDQAGRAAIDPVVSWAVSGAPSQDPIRTPPVPDRRPATPCGRQGHRCPFSSSR